ncbi:transcription elongation factor GreA [Hydrogenoanaerobacterium saccharovorans]|uniref:transcription elongation factor GreA n=1 Tax=Hydrogenoanaerobacterium saccharovorans TaxID=474960 RepID=UPI001967D0E3|nr:transcription elongation factor GreA [Hydrogenoanaerobacterium saccharovorans]
MKLAKEIILTEEGLKKLQEEFETLKTVKRKEVAEKIKIARGFGDLSENSEYDEAKNEQAIVEARIAEVEAMLKIARVLDEDEIAHGTVSVGSIVKLKDLEFDEIEEYYVVGSTESDPMNNKVSDESPLGKALIGKKSGDKVSVDAPSGPVPYEILDVTR